MSVRPFRKPVGLSWTKKLKSSKTFGLISLPGRKALERRLSEVDLRPVCIQLEKDWISIYIIISSCPIYYFVYLHYFPLLSPLYLNISSLYPLPNSMKVPWANSSTLSQGSKGDLAIPGPVPHWSWRLVQLRRPDLLEPTRRSAWRPAEGRA